MSPEQVRGADVDRRTDVFALGVVLYEMLTGRRAFLRETVPETMTAILRDDLPDIRSSNPQVSLPLEQVLRRCVDKDPARRFEAMHDLAIALGAIEAAPTSSTTAVTSVPEFVPPVSEKRRPGLPIAAVVFVALAFGAIVAMMNGC
jgi:serine/threonine protein kinase